MHEQEPVEGTCSNARDPPHTNRTSLQSPKLQKRDWSQQAVSSTGGTRKARASSWRMCSSLLAVDFVLESVGGGGRRLWVASLPRVLVLGSATGSDVLYSRLQLAQCVWTHEVLSSAEKAQKPVLRQENWKLNGAACRPKNQALFRHLLGMFQPPRRR